MFSRPSTLIDACSAGVLLAVCTALSSRAQAQQFTATPQFAPDPTNVLLIIGDDVGVDMVSCYGEQANSPPTPNLDALAARGVLFRNAYSQPVCSPARAGILTGRYGFRLGIGISIQTELPEFSLALDEVTLAELVNADKPGTLPCSAIGKWHLGSILNGGAFNPNQQGFDWFAGTLDNFKNGQSFFSHSRVLNGVSSASTTYATTEQVNDALAQIQVMPQPWFCYLAFNAPHRPFHAPPQSLHTYSLFGPPMQSPAQHFRAAVQAMDTEIGRLLSSINSEVLEHTTIIFVGDNGSPPDTVLPPFLSTAAKATLFEGGVNVPLIVAGHHVDAPGAECAAFVNTVDLFPTIGGLLGTSVVRELPDGRPIDGVDLLPYLRDPTHGPLRSWVYSDQFDPNGWGPYASHGRMLRNERWKVITREGAQDLFYDMQGLAREGPSLDLENLDGEQRAAYDWLKRELAVLLAS